MWFESKLDRYVETTFRSNESERLKMQLIEEIRNATRNELRELRELIEIQKDVVESIDDKKQLADLENSLDDWNYSRWDRYDRDNYYNNWRDYNDRYQEMPQVNIIWWSIELNPIWWFADWKYDFDWYEINPDWSFDLNFKKKHYIHNENIRINQIYPNSINIEIWWRMYNAPLMDYNNYKILKVWKMELILDWYFPENRWGHNRWRDRDNYYNWNDYRRNH